MSLVFILLLYVHLKQQDNSITCSLFYNSKCIIKFLKFFEVYNSFYYIIIQWYKFCLSVGFACNTFFPKDILFLKTCFFIFLSPPPNLKYKSHFLCIKRRNQSHRMHLHRRKERCWRSQNLMPVFEDKRDPHLHHLSLPSAFDFEHPRFQRFLRNLYRSLIKVFSSRQIWDSYFG